MAGYETRSTTPRTSCRGSQERWSCSPVPRTLDFQALAEEVTGHPVAVYQRIAQAGYKLLIDDRILADTDTLMCSDSTICSPRTGSRPRRRSRDQGVLKQEGKCLLLAPHHDVASPTTSLNASRYQHHGDRFGPQTTALQPVHASLMKLLEPCPCTTRGVCGPRCRGHPGDSAAHRIPGSRPNARLLDDVTTFNFTRTCPTTN